MDTFDNETLEQIKNIVNDAKNEKAPLQRAKRTKKIKEINIIVPPTEEHNNDAEPVEMLPAIPVLTRQKSIKIELPAPTQLLKKNYYYQLLKKTKRTRKEKESTK